VFFEFSVPLASSTVDVLMWYNRWTANKKCACVELIPFPALNYGWNCFSEMFINDWLIDADRCWCWWIVPGDTSVRVLCPRTGHIERTDCRKLERHYPLSIVVWSCVVCECAGDVPQFGLGHTPSSTRSVYALSLFCYFSTQSSNCAVAGRCVTRFST
jgi:hypothetical protein